jgi:hypothetical protein
MNTWVWFTIWSLGLAYVSYRAGLYLGLRHIRASAEKIAREIGDHEAVAAQVFGGLRADLEGLKADLKTSEELNSAAMKNSALVPHLPTLMKNLPGIKKGIDKLNEGELLRMDELGIYQERPEGRKDLITFDESFMELIGTFLTQQQKGKGEI